MFLTPIEEKKGRYERHQDCHIGANDHRVFHWSKAAELPDNSTVRPMIDRNWRLPFKTAL
jgi:hypothetical protein